MENQMDVYLHQQVHMSQMPGMVTMDTTHRMDTIGRSGVLSSWSNTDTGSYVATPRSTVSGVITIYNIMQGLDYMDAPTVTQCSEGIY